MLFFALIIRINRGISKILKQKIFIPSFPWAVYGGFDIKTLDFLAVALMLTLLVTMAASAEEKNGISGAEAMQKLLEGNARYVSGNVSHQDQYVVERRSELISSQHPFAIVVGCSDSRVPPEAVFDQGLGDIFVVRTAGQVLDNASLGSIEYAVEHLGVPLVVVLGHDNCGAVTAAVKGGEAPGHLKSLVESIQPAVDEAKKMNNEGELLNNSIDNNIKNIQKSLESAEPILSEKVRKGELKVVGARYHLDTGVVQIIENNESN